MTNTANDAAGRFFGDAVYGERIKYLSEFMLPERFSTMSRAVGLRSPYMTVMTENMFHAQNASAIVRHCEAFGIQNLHTVEALCPFTPNLNIVRGTDKWIDIHPHATTSGALSALRAGGYRIVATTPHRQSCTPESFDVRGGRFALVFGTEKQGISEEVFDCADAFLKIPMCGMVESLNVSASAAILLYMLSERMRAEVEGWQYPPEEQAAILYRWFRSSVKDADALLLRAGYDL